MAFSAMALTIFTADLWKPPGVSMCAGYLLPLLLSASPQVRFSPYLLASFLSVLSVTGFFYGSPGDEHVLSLAKRGPDIAALWLFALLISRYRRALQAAERLSRVVEQSPNAMVITDKAGHAQFANSRFFKMTGYSRGEVIGQHLGALMPAGEYQKMWQTITQGGRWEGQFHNRKKNGDLFWEEDSISPVTTEAGEIIHFIAVKEDITRRKAAEQEMRERDTRHRLISENLVDVICQLDPTTGRFSYVSHSVQRLLGYTRAEALAKTVGDIMHPDSRKKALAAARSRIAHFRRSPSGISSYQDEFFLYGKDNSIVSVEVTSTYMRNELGKPSIIAVVRNIGERKPMEREVLRRIELEQERIGRDLHDCICQLLVATKFRSALLAKKLREENLPWAMEEVNLIEQSLSQTIVQTRDLAKGLNPVQLESNGLVRALADLAEFITSTGSVNCRCQISATTKIPGGDVARHLYRITQEAVQNALKHGQARNISIILSEDAANLSLVVADDGVGLPDNYGDSSGSGLPNMMARAAMIGGRLILKRGAQGGCAAKVILPVVGRQNP
jgi:PAS domain S-box-containing protein